MNKKRKGVVHKNTFNNTTEYGFGRKSVQRLYLRPNQSKEIVFIDDTPHVATVHTVWKDRRPFYYTCTGTNNCPLCLKGNKTRRVFALTVIDTTPWTDRLGNVHDENVVLFEGDWGITGILKAEKEKYGTLKNLKFRIEKTSKLSPAPCDRFTYIGKDMITPTIYESYNYNEIYEPVLIGELEEVASEL
jgi:hypothetical protein